MTTVDHAHSSPVYDSVVSTLSDPRKTIGTPRTCDGDAPPRNKMRGSESHEDTSENHSTGDDLSDDDDDDEEEEEDDDDDDDDLPAMVPIIHPKHPVMTKYQHQNPHHTAFSTGNLNSTDLSTLRASHSNHKTVLNSLVVGEGYGSTDDDGSFLSEYRNLDRPIQLGRPLFWFLISTALLSICLAILAISGLSLDLREDILHVFYGPGFQIGHKELGLEITEQQTMEAISVPVAPQLYSLTQDEYVSLATLTPDQVPVVVLNNKTRKNQNKIVQKKHQRLEVNANLDPLPSQTSALPEESGDHDILDDSDQFNSVLRVIMTHYMSRCDAANSLSAIPADIVHHQPYATNQISTTKQRYDPSVDNKAPNSRQGFPPQLLHKNNQLRAKLETMSSPLKASPKLNSIHELIKAHDRQPPPLSHNANDFTSSNNPILVPDDLKNVLLNLYNLYVSSYNYHNKNVQRQLDIYATPSTMSQNIEFAQVTHPLDAMNISGWYEDNYHYDGVRGNDHPRCEHTNDHNNCNNNNTRSQTVKNPTTQSAKATVNMTLLQYQIHTNELEFITLTQLEQILSTCQKSTKFPKTSPTSMPKKTILPSSTTTTTTTTTATKDIASSYDSFGETDDHSFRTFGHSIIISWDGMPMVSTIVQPYTLCIMKCVDLTCSSGESLLFTFTPTASQQTLALSSADFQSAQFPHPVPRMDYYYYSHRNDFYTKHQFGHLTLNSMGKVQSNNNTLSLAKPPLSFQHTQDLSAFFTHILTSPQLNSSNTTQSDNHNQARFETISTAPHFDDDNKRRAHRKFLTSSIFALPAQIRTLALSQPITRLVSSTNRDPMITLTDVSGSILVFSCTDAKCFPPVDTEVTQDEVKKAVKSTQVATTASFSSADVLLSPLGNQLIAYIDAITNSPVLIICLSTIACQLSSRVDFVGVRTGPNARVKLAITGDGNVSLTTSGTCTSTVLSPTSFVSRFTTAQDSLNIFNAMTEKGLISDGTLQHTFDLILEKYISVDEVSGDNTIPVLDPSTFDIRSYDYTTLFIKNGLGWILNDTVHNSQLSLKQAKLAEIYNILLNYQNCLENSKLFNQLGFPSHGLSTNNVVHIHCSRLDCLSGYYTIAMPFITTSYSLDAIQTFQNNSPNIITHHNTTPTSLLSDSIVQGVLMDVTVTTGSLGYPLFAILYRPLYDDWNIYPQPTPSNELVLMTFACFTYHCNHPIIAPIYDEVDITEDNTDPNSPPDPKTALVLKGWRYLYSNLATADNIAIHATTITSLTNRIQIRTSPYGAASTLIQYEHLGSAILAECVDTFCKSTTLNPLFMEATASHTSSIDIDEQIDLLSSILNKEDKPRATDTLNIANDLPSEQHPMSHHKPMPPGALPPPSSFKRTSIQPNLRHTTSLLGDLIKHGTSRSLRRPLPSSKSHHQFPKTSVLPTFQSHAIIPPKEQTKASLHLAQSTSSVYRTVSTGRGGGKSTPCVVSPCGDIRISSVDGMPVAIFGSEMPTIIHCSNMLCLPYVIH